MTADCVPVLVAGPEGLAAIHAGWRGIVGGIIPATLARMKGEPAEWTAWVGPAIGACCYEVGDDVARQVVGASGPEVAIPGPAGKPHLDLPAPPGFSSRGPASARWSSSPAARGATRKPLELSAGREEGGAGPRAHLAAPGRRGL